MPIYEVAKEVTFAAAHHLRNYHGKCESVHGHNFRVRVTLRGETLGPGGMLVDFKQLKNAMWSVIDALDHHDLNTVPPFDEIEPSSEHIAAYIARGVQTAVATFSAARVHKVEVWETPTSRATYYPDAAD